MAHFNMSEIQSAPAAVFQVHPAVLKTWKKKGLDGLQLLIHKFGQQTSVKVVERDGHLYVIDGVGVLHCINVLKIPSVIYQVVEIEDEKIMEFRFLSNSRTKKTFTDTCLQAEAVFNLVGNSQGKKRKRTGYENTFSEEVFDEIAKDTYELVRALLGVDYKRTLFREGMKLFRKTYNPNGDSKFRILERIDSGDLKISAAVKLLEKEELKEKTKKETEAEKTAAIISIQNSPDKPYELYNKSSLTMNEVNDNSLALIIDSHPYYNQRVYRNQDETIHGQEKTKEEYFENFRRFNEEKLKKLKPGGVLVTILGESYKGGYQRICNRAEQILEEIGFELIDTVVWVKTNQKWAAHPYRFQNVKETILVAKKPGAEPYFSPVLRPGSAKSKSVKRSNSKGGFYIPNLETCIPNVIVTDAFNWKELSMIDPKFRHDAPCPSEIYKIFIEAYSQPGDTILDGFIGTGTLGLGLKTGRRVIGYDVDNESLEFCRKRFDHYLSELVAETQSMAA